MSSPAPVEVRHDCPEGTLRSRANPPSAALGRARGRGRRASREDAGSPVINGAVPIAIWRTRAAAGESSVVVVENGVSKREGKRERGREVRHAGNINAASLIVSEDSRASRLPMPSSILLRDVPRSRFAIARLPHLSL